MALGILVYHYMSWTYGSFGAEHFLGRIGVYGVSIFYVLSGLTLYTVYINKVGDQILNYVKKRVFRIFPLLWISILLNIFLLNQDHSVQKLILNFTGLFGFLAPSEYIPTGAWSIGNELVFYSLFPIIALLNAKSKYSIYIVLFFSLCITIWFSSNQMSIEGGLSKFWPTYINPLNQLVLFVGGMAIGKALEKYRGHNVAWIIFALSIGTLVFYPTAEGDRIALVTGVNRVVFVLVSIGLTSFFYLKGFPKITGINWLLSKLGDISYSVYLIHPIMYWFIAKNFKSYVSRTEEPLLFIIIAITTTFITSALIYYQIEKRFIRLGNKI